MNIVGAIDDKPVYWANSNSQPQKLSLAGFPSGLAYGINSLRQIVGEIQTDDFLGQPVPVYWADPNSQPQKLSLGGYKGGGIFGINSLGQSVGFLADDPQ